MKQFFLYNIKSSVTDEQYDKFLRDIKGPMISTRPHNTGFTMYRLNKDSSNPKSYQYLGIVSISDPKGYEKDCDNDEWRDFVAQWSDMVDGDVFSLEGEEIATWKNWTV